MPAQSAESQLLMPGFADFDETLVAAFTRAAEAFPAKTALCSDLWQPTYRELNATANRLAHGLIDRGSQGDRVAILMAHDTPAICAAAGVLKTGRIVVALGASDPVPRLKMLMADAEPSVIITDAENKELADEVAGDACNVAVFETEIASGRTNDPSVAIKPEQTAFLIYTSGATGRPKGVMYTHRQFRRNAAIHTEAMQYTAADRIPLMSTMSSGQAASAICYSLINGATLYPFPVRTKGVTGLAEWIIDRGLTVYVSSASIFRTLTKTLDKETVFPDVRTVRLASEAVTADDFRAFRRHFPPTSVFVHTLATSETGNIAWSRWPHDADVPDGVLPVGHVSRGFEVSLVGDDGAPVAPGEIGEIQVKSRYVANGFWRDPALTAERFSDDLDGSGTRLVRTGDMARFNQVGELEFCGRRDNRVKIRGNRIELTDIEWAMAKLPGVDRAAVVAVPRANQEPMLVAFVVLTRDASLTVARLRHAVAANLPLHMVPSRFEFVDALPFGPGGKIDRDALRQIPLTRRDGSLGEAPKSETETLIADIWAETLDVSAIARDEDFFSLSGDSLKGAIVAAQIHSTFGVEVSLAEIATHATVSALADLVDGRGRAGDAGTPPIMPVRRSGPMPLSLFQLRIWAASQTRTIDPEVRVIAISGPLDADVLKECLSYLIERHESLRTTFGIYDGEPAQIVHPSGLLDLSFVDVSTAANPEERAHAILAAETVKPIDPGTLPTFRHVLIKIRENEHRLLRLTHPMTQDGSSFAILTNELAALYEARLAGTAPPLPKKMPLQYCDFAVWQHRVMGQDGPAYRDMFAWWENIFSQRLRPVRLPFRRAKPRKGVDPALGVIYWQLEGEVARRLDRIARGAAATYFIIRLALFVALVADMMGRSNVVFSTVFVNRHRIATSNIVGNFSSLTPLVFSYDPRWSLQEWIEVVRNRLFETEIHAEIPYEELYERLRATGLRPPPGRILFAMSAEFSEHRFGGLTWGRFPYVAPRMPWGCQVYVDEKVAENCRVEFDAGLYDRDGMKAMVDRYVRLLEITSQQPDLTVGRLVAMSSDNSVRRAIANYLPMSKKRESV